MLAPAARALRGRVRQLGFGVATLSMLLSMVLALLAASCKAHVTEVHWETACESACEARATNCMPAQCRRGCGFVLDRAEEKITDVVVTCVAKQTRCEDPEWAFCGARVGPLEHGGAPAPPPPVDPADEN
jgi:hypothetical protein